MTGADAVSADEVRRATVDRLRSRRRWRTCVGVAVFVMFVAATLWRAARVGDEGRFAFDADRTYRVERVVDGDTLLLEGGQRVRLLGVDTPETKHPSRPPEPFGEEASARTAERLAGRDVRLVFDRERVDVYDRVLAWVYVDDECWNVTLVREGLSRAVLRSPLRPDLKKALLEAEEIAERGRVGIWSLVDDE